MKYLRVWQVGCCRRLRRLAPADDAGPAAHFMFDNDRQARSSSASR
jgi:hypothetical protein